jgi:hypothetical protein
VHVGEHHREQVFIHCQAAQHEVGELARHAQDGACRTEVGRRAALSAHAWA